jgi:hypothetical protein
MKKQVDRGTELRYDGYKGAGGWVDNIKMNLRGLGG